MRLGIVRGHVVLHTAVPELRGTRLVIVEPVTSENLARRSGLGGGKALVLADHLDPGHGQMVAFVEGREAANPYWPGKAPVDAYCALIVDGTPEFHPPVEGDSPTAGQAGR
jgi:microcompartment protein CcmK/EutM